jgi:hypothetical protein
VPHSLTVALILLLCLHPGLLPLWAEPREPFLPRVEEEDTPERQPDEDTEEDTEEEPGLIDVAHERVSETILSSARRIDAFFSDERALREETDTRLRLGISNFTQEGDLLQTNLRASFRLDLPVFTERFRLLFTGEEEEEERTFAQPARIPRTPAVTPRERQTSISLRYFLLSTLRQNASISTRVRLHNGSPIFVMEPRYRQTVPVKDWDFRFTQRLAAYSDDRLEIHTIFDLERPVGRDLFFRTTAAGVWLDPERNYYYGLHLALFQPLSRERMIQYLWANNFVTRPTQVLEGITFSVSYRQKIWREWLFFEVTPQIFFPREQDYEFSPALLLRLDIIFGEFSSFGINNM